MTETRTSPSHQRYLDAGCVVTRTEPGTRTVMGKPTTIHFYGRCATCRAEMRDVDERGFEDASGSPYTATYCGPADPGICTRCAHQNMIDGIDLTGRSAKCMCGRTVPSTWSLAFFEFQGPGSQWATEHCAVCGYSPQAHDPARPHMARVEKGGRTRYENFMERNGGVHEFTPRGGDAGHDRFYCGCRGWD